LKLATLVSQEVGYNSGKKVKGRKRHILVDTLDLLLVVVIAAAILFSGLTQLAQHDHIL
jgi:putative transposase